MKENKIRKGDDFVPFSRLVDGRKIVCLDWAFLEDNVFFERISIT